MSQTLRLRRTILTTFACLLAAAMVSTGCGVPTDSSPSILAIEQMSDEFVADELAPEPTATPTGTQLLTGGAAVYFMNSDNHLQAIQREVVLLTSDERAQPVVEALIAGPDDEERDLLGLTTGIPSDLVVNEITVNDSGLAIVDIGAGPLDELLGDNFRIPLAQLVYTLTELEGIESFRLTIDGEDQQIGTDFGTTEKVEPVTRLDYASYKPIIEPAEESEDADAQPATNSDGVVVPTLEAFPQPTATPLPTPVPTPAVLASPEPTPDE